MQRGRHMQRESSSSCAGLRRYVCVSTPTFCAISILGRDAEPAALALPHGGNAKVQALAAQPRSCRAGKPLS